MGNPTRQQPPPQTAAPPAQQPPPPPPPPQQDGATLIQEQLDNLALACFNAVLEVTKARAGDGAGTGGGAQLHEQQRTKVGLDKGDDEEGSGVGGMDTQLPFLSHTELLPFSSSRNRSRKSGWRLAPCSGRWRRPLTACPSSLRPPPGEKPGNWGLMGYF